MRGQEMAAEIQKLRNELDAADHDARALVAGLDEARGRWRATVGSWSVAECLDHLAIANRVYLRAMQVPAMRAREQGRWRRRPAMPGIIGRWFVGILEPPVNPRFKVKAPRSIRPRESPPLAEAFADFIASQNEVRAFLASHADLDLAGVRFPNPFIRGVRFSLATGLHVIAAHERRHLLQAWRVREEAQRAAA